MKIPTESASDFDDTPISILNNPVSLSDLITNGANFEINPSFDDDEFVSELFDELNIGSDGEDEDDGEGAKLVSPWLHSFEELRQQMEKVNDHIYKRVTKEGNEEKGNVGGNDRVCIRYNAYWEGEGAPFDSSFLRGTSHSFYTGRGEVLEGLECAVRTMKKGEEAQFVISYKLLFLEMGCPPRVKPKADGLFIIECVDFNPIGNFNATDDLHDDERKKFSTVLATVKEVHLKGLDFFKQGMYKFACRAFLKAINALNFCHLRNADEESTQKAFLIKLYTNLAVCYNKLNLPSKTMIMCHELRRLTNNELSCKALFQEGRALLLLGEFARARGVLVQAQQMEPNNADVNNELKTLEARYTKYKENERQLWTRAMSAKESKKNVELHLAPQNEAQSAFQLEISKMLQKLKEDADFKSFTLPPGLTSDEIKLVDDMTKEMGMKLQLSPLDNTTYTIFRQ